ncbi:RNase H domain-containing protein [Trichonephila clavipes]|nr:RNase H domain-containing protein [Trichonephila clavipes]
MTDYHHIPQIATSLTLTSDILKLPNLHLSFTLHFLGLVGKELPLFLSPKNPKDMLMKRCVSLSHTFNGSLPMLTSLEMKSHISWLKEAAEIATTDYALTYREIYSLMKIKDMQVWMAPPDHPGISRESPGVTLEFDRNYQTTVSRLLSGYLKCMTFKSGHKVFQTCPKCHLLPASPEHILNCLGLACEDVHASPLLVLDFARGNDLMDMI